MISVFGFVLVALCAYRVTRVLTTDAISLPWRNRLYSFAWDEDAGEVTTVDGQQVLTPLSRGPLRSYVYELFTCSQCLGVWVAAATYSAWRWWDTDAVHAIIAVFAVAGAQSFLSLVVDRGD